MCALCKEVDQAELSPEKIKGLLEAIAAAIAAGGSHKHFENATNKLLGTEMEARDLEAEKRWELTYRSK